MRVFNVTLIFVCMSGIASLSRGEVQPPPSLGDRAYESRGNPSATNPFQAGGAPTASAETSDNKNSRNFLTGKCLVKAIDAKGSMPCPPFPVVLLNGNGKEVAKSIVAQGSFWFAIKDDKTYYLKFDAPDFTIQAADLGPYHRGARADITVTKR